MYRQTVHVQEQRNCDVTNNEGETNKVGFHSCTVHLDTIKVFHLPTDAQKSCFKIILKFTLKQLLHVSVQLPSSGSLLFELAKFIVIKIIS